MNNWTDAQKTAIGLRDQLILVSAAAGSGKTAVLTERIIQRILDADANLKLTDLLIVTFTRAAAAELKSKIAKAIEAEIAREDLDEQKKDNLRNQLLQLGSAQISTIDSFYLQIVRAHFESLGLPANFRLADANELRVISEEILDSLIPEFYKLYEAEDFTKDAENPFTKVSNNPFADCVDHVFSGHSSDNLNKTFLDFYESFARIKGGIEALRKSAEVLRAESGLPFLHTQFGKAFLAHLESCILPFYATLQDVKSHHETDPEGTRNQEGVLADDMSHCEWVLQAIEQQDWNVMQKAFSAFTFCDFRSPSGVKPEWSIRYQGARGNFKKNILDLYKPLVDSITPAEQKKTFLQTAAFADMLYQFFSKFKSRYTAEKIARGMQDFNDVRDAVYALLTKPENEAFAKSIRETYKEIYIDEYQDVDEIQDEIFARIGGNNRFMVGDIKQSIYGFRGSDPSVFAGYRNALPLSTTAAAKTATSVCVFMSDNFRCDQPVIDLTNAVCSFLFSASPNSIHYLPEDDLNFHKPKDKTVPTPAPVSIRIFERKGKDEKSESQEESNSEEIAWVVGEIRRLLREGKKDDGSNIEPHDIAILARKKEPLIKFQKALEACGISVANSVGNSIAHAPLFVELLNLIRIVDNPYRDLPLSEYLLSDFGGFSLGELRSLRTDFSTDQSLYDALLLAADAETPLAKKAEEFIAWLENYRRIATVQSADRFLRVLYQDRRFCPYAFTPEFLTIYEQARIYQQSSWTGLYGFLNYLERLTDADQLESSGFRKAESAVNAMTIHASKGLEYPVVFLVGCGGKMINDGKKTPLIYRKEIGFASDLFNKETGISAPSFLSKISNMIQRDVEVEEEVRLLYVALTRAREKLYITASPSRKKDTFLSDASLIERDDRFSILSAKSYIDWIYATLQKAPAEMKKVDLLFLSEAASTPATYDAPAENPAHESKEAKPESPDVAFYRSVLEKAKTFSYPLAALKGIPTKAAASKLKENLLDTLKSGTATEALTERLSLMHETQPSFQGLLDAHKQPTPAEIGTATHAFLALCNFANLSGGVEEELKRLVEQKFISAETAAIVNLRALKRFAASPLMKKIETAKTVLREQQFSLFLPLAELTQNTELAAALKGKELFVQGSIDLILIGENGEIELYDYKTDRITEEERTSPALLRQHLQERHGNQLQAYSRAVEQLFGKKPDRISIFSLSLGEIIEL